MSQYLPIIPQTLLRLNTSSLDSFFKLLFLCILFLLLITVLDTFIYQTIINPLCLCHYAIPLGSCAPITVLYTCVAEPVSFVTAAGFGIPPALGSKLVLLLALKSFFKTLKVKNNKESPAPA